VLTPAEQIASEIGCGFGGFQGYSAIVVSLSECSVFI
jgi:hypothetical protein